MGSKRKHLGKKARSVILKVEIGKKIYIDAGIVDTSEKWRKEK